MKSISRIAISIGLLMSFVAPAHAWSDEDTAWESAYLATHLVDWGQTRDIANKCDSDTDVYEKNPLLGSCPSTMEVNLYFIGTALLHTSASRMLPVKYRRMFQMGTLGLQLNSVNNNKRIGLKVSF
jgi:hypothetical protein